MLVSVAIMTDIYAADSPDWRDCPELPGWQIMAKSLDYGSKWGVAIKKGEERHAVRVLREDEFTQAEAEAYGLPTLRAMAGIAEAAA